MKIKILHIGLSDSYGGAAIASYRLHSLMNQCNDLSSKMLVLLKYKSDLKVYELKYANKFIARINRYFDRLINLFNKKDLPFSLGFLKNDLQNNFLVQESDIIYIHWINSGLLTWKSIEKLIRLKKPIVLFAHDMWFFSGGCHHSSGGKNVVLNNKKYHLFGTEYFDNVLMKKIVISAFFRKVRTFSSHENVHIIAPSSQFKNSASRTNIISNSRLHFIPNILDINKFKPINKKNKKIKILYGAFGGKSNIFKGWTDFIYFGKKINKTYGSKISFELFGYDFTDTELQNIPFQVMSHGLILDESKLISIYQNADVYIFPSSFESFGQTLIEAMSCGLVPISYDVGFASDIIKNKINGFIVKRSDKDGLISSFNELMLMNIKLLKNNSRISIENYFSTEILINKHLDLINSIFRQKL